MKKRINFASFALGSLLAAVVVSPTVSLPVSFAAASPTAISNLLQGLVTPGTATTSFVLQPGDKSIAVADLQELLIRQGYLSVAAPTGYFGQATQAAVMALQKAENVSQTGSVTIPVSKSAALHASGFSPISVGSTGAYVKSIQQFLAKHGYLKISTSTSYFGSMTETAVIAFQKARNLPQTGTVDRATFSAMSWQ